MAEVNYVPITDPIQQVITTFKFNDTNWLPDAITWAFEVLKAVRCQNLVKSISKNISVKNFRYDLPQEFIGIRAVETLDGYKVPKDSDITITHETPDNNYFIANPRTLNFYNDTPSTSAVVESSNINANLAYNLDGNTFMLNKKSADVTIHYNVWHVNEDGCLLIPDLYNLRQAIYWQLVVNLLTVGYTNPVITYQFADAKLSYFIKEANREIKMPSFDQALVAATTVVRLVPSIIEGFNFGKGLNHMQFVDK